MTDETIGYSADGIRQKLDFEKRFPGNPQSDTLKPSYYTQGGIECFDVIDAFGMDFYIGNVLKYISRWKSKGGVEDLKKARVYLDRRIAQAEKEAGKP